MQDFSGREYVGTNQDQLQVQQEGVEGCSGSLGCTEGSLDCLYLPLDEAIQLVVVQERSDMLNAMLL